ncbi:Filament-like plant protein 3 [Linum perenne]
MDQRRSWLWRTKSTSSAVKIIPATADFSDVGSLGSLSERFSDHQPSYSSTATQSPLDDVNVDDDGDLAVLKRKLSEALISLRTKDDLVAQHARVAEEAVSGSSFLLQFLFNFRSWEKAEKEVVNLKQQLEKKNGGLEDRVGHLDAALKECMSQLRLARARIEVLEKENSSLELILQSRAEELEIRTMERDLSSKAAEAASKQHLEAMKRVSRLEAECRKARGRRRTNTKNEVEVEPELEPECGGFGSCARLMIMVPSSEIDLMDDFLEMERLASQPSAVSCQSSITTEIDAMIDRRDELEKAEHERIESELALSDCQCQLKEANIEVSLLRDELAHANESIKAKEDEIRDLLSRVDSLEAELEKEAASAAENSTKCVELENKIYEMKNESRLRREYELKRAVSFKEAVNAKQVHNHIVLLYSSWISLVLYQCEIYLNVCMVEFALQERELGVAAAKFAECQKTISNLGRQLKSLATLEEELLVSS